MVFEFGTTKISGCLFRITGYCPLPGPVQPQIQARTIAQLSLLNLVLKDKRR